ncbi:16308_t:CDS:10 [Rhizophagus irregularis]|nr:16308_t:CDS:10 [Rhizophagus irregularis]
MAEQTTSRRSSTIKSPTTPPLQEDNPISQKVSKILLNPIDDVKTKIALEALSEFYSNNNNNSLIIRRNLRGNIEQKAIEANRNFLEIFGKITEQLAVIESEVKSMNTFCNEIEKSLESANRQIAVLLEQSDSLKSQRFTLSEKEVTVITSPNSIIGQEFFDALKHLQQIHGDCDTLLITENQRAGLEIMERMNSYQEVAFDKLYRWTQTETRTLGQESLEVPITMRQALKALKQRPVLFQSCLEELVHIRRNAVSRAFMDALVRGGQGGTPKPIEIHSHDPLRYVGDMLAWVHQAVAGEKEFLESLFEPEPNSNNEFIQEEVIARESDDIIIQDLLDRDLDGTCRPLMTRVEQVIGSQIGAITGYRILNLIQFYKITIARILGPNANLSNTLEDITEIASRVFFNILNAQAEQLLRYIQTPSSDLSPPPAVKEVVLQLKAIMASYETSLITASEKEKDFKSILDAILDPLFQMCELGAKDLTKFNQAIYMVNCLHYVQYANLLRQSGLKPIVQAIETKDEKTPLSLVHNMNAKSLANIMAKLDSFLSLSDSDTFKLQGHPKPLVKKVNQRVSKLFIEAYRKVNDAIKDPKNRYEFPNTILVRTVDEIENILLID